MRIAEDVVHLVRVVAAAGGDDRIRPRGEGRLVGNLGVGVGEREDDRPRCHLLQHGRRDHIARGETDQDVLAGRGLVERAHRRVHRECALVRIHLVRSPGVDDAELVEHGDALAPHAELDPQLHAANRGRARAHAKNGDLIDLLLANAEGVEERGAGDDGGSVLIVVKDGNLHPFLQLLFDVKAIRSADVLEIDGAEGRLESVATASMKRSGLGVEPRSNTSMSASRLKKQRFPSITGLAARGPMLPRPRTPSRC